MKAGQLMVLLVTVTTMLLASPSCGRSRTPVPLRTPTAVTGTPVVPLRTPTAVTGTPVPAATGPVAPAISDINVLDQRYDLLSVSWKTNEPTISRMEYGLTLEYGQSTAWTTEPSLFHVVIETGLVPYQAYHLRLRVK